MEKITPAEQLEEAHETMNLMADPLLASDHKKEAYDTYMEKYMKPDPNKELRSTFQGYLDWLEKQNDHKTAFEMAIHLRILATDAVKAEAESKGALEALDKFELAWFDGDNSSINGTLKEIRQQYTGRAE